MARLRSSQSATETTTSKPSHLKAHDEAEEDDLEATSNADGDDTFSTANENMGQQMEKNTKTPTPGVLSRVYRRVLGTPRSLDKNGPDNDKEKSVDPKGLDNGRGKSADSNNDDEEEKSVDQGRTDNNEGNEPGSPSLSDVLFGSGADEEAEVEAEVRVQVEEPEENAQEEPAELAIVLAEEEQCQAQLIGNTELGHDVVLENPMINGSEVDGIDPQPVAQKSPSAHKLKPKPAIYNDNSFQYSKPKKVNPRPSEKDVYEFPASHDEEEAPQQTTKTGKNRQTSKKSNDKLKKSEKATKHNEETIDKVVISPAKPRGRPPSSSQNTTAHKLPVNESSTGEKRKPGRPKAPKMERIKQVISTDLAAARSHTNLVMKITFKMVMEPLRKMFLHL